MPKRWRKGKWLLLSIIILVFLVVAQNTGIQRNNITLVEQWVRDMLAPLQSGATAVLDGVGSVDEYFSSKAKLTRENNELEKEIARLKDNLSNANEIQLENIRLRRLLGMEENIQKAWTTITAKVIARDVGNWYHTVTVDRGLADGVKNDQVVLNQDGLVGKTINVTEHTAEILLILDKEGAVGCQTQLSRTPGVVEGTSGSSDVLRMIHCPLDAELKENQVVVTSGLGGTFPAGLRIGFITEVKVESNGLMKQALVQPFVDFDRLEEVLILVK